MRLERRTIYRQTIWHSLAMIVWGECWDTRVWTKKKEDNKKDNFSISLLWHSKTSQLADGSDAFGRLLPRVCDFSSWIPKLEKEMKSLKYQYFSSNCCRVDDEVSRIFHWLFLCFFFVVWCFWTDMSVLFWSQHVLRSYDSRFRPTTRSPVIYLNKACRAIVGGEARKTK